MSRANAVLLSLAVSMLFGANAAASGVTSSGYQQSADSDMAVQSQSATTMNVPLLVYVDARGQVRGIQQSQRLPSAVSDLLWKSVKSWTKSSPVINGRHQGAQVFMNVTLHAEPLPGGKTNVYFTLASEGPVLSGYWRMVDNRLYGRCSLGTSDMTGGVGGRQRWCYSQVIPGPASTALASPAK